MPQIRFVPTGRHLQSKSFFFVLFLCIWLGLIELNLAEIDRLTYFFGIIFHVFILANIGTLRLIGYRQKGCQLLPVWALYDSPRPLGSCVNRVKSPKEHSKSAVSFLPNCSSNSTQQPWPPKNPINTKNISSSNSAHWCSCRQCLHEAWWVNVWGGISVDNVTYVWSNVGVTSNIMELN